MDVKDLKAKAGFFGTLLDFSFTEFVTTKIIKFLYILAIVVLGLMSLGWLIAGILGGALSAILSLILVPLFFALMVIYTRVALEIIMVIFRIAENTSEIAKQGKKES